MSKNTKCYLVFTENPVKKTIFTLELRGKNKIIYAQTIYHVGWMLQKNVRQKNKEINRIPL